jgi:SAM-dependent methyltransferase
MVSLGPSMMSRLVQVLRDRRKKQSMTEASYWDERARSRSGFARSVWHSETFSQAWDERQQDILRDTLRSALGTLRDKRIADVGCGTGRITRFLAREGAHAIGIDFSPETVRAAAEESRAQGLSPTFLVGDATTGSLPVEDGSCDAALTVGCLAVACRDLAALEQSFRALAKAVLPGAPVLILEPIHTTRFLGRVLRASLSEWLATADRAGLTPVGDRGMGFVPARLALSSFDLPAWVVRPTFASGELLLDSLPALDRASDYRLLSLRRRA